LSAIVVTCEELSGVFTIKEAEEQDASLVWKDKPGNIFYEGAIERGDITESAEQAKVIVSGEFSTSRIIHGFMEPECGLAKPDGDGGVEIYYPSQTVFDDQIQVAEVLGLPRDKVRVVQLPTGGAFGGKEDLVFHHILALAALTFDRPVKITLTREESLRVGQRKHPMQFKASLSLTGEGLFLGLNAEIKADKGAYATLGFDIIENAMAFVGGPYFIPSVSINGRSFYTNNIMSGAMRGFGANQGNFVIESLVDMAACELDMDPFEIRFINALRPGLPTVTDHVLEPGIPGVEETLLAAKTAFENEMAPAVTPGKRLGMGIACGVKNVGFGHGLPESAGAKVALHNDGTCHLYVTHHEYGQGAAIGQARIASETLGIPVEKIVVSAPDTSQTPYTGATTASRQTFLSGNATLGACRLLKSDLFETAASQMSVLDPASLQLIGSYIVSPNGDQRLPLSELGECFNAEFRTFPPETEGLLENGGTSQYGTVGFQSRRTHWAYAYGVQIAWVAVDEETGKTKVLKVITAGDVGHVLNRKAVEGQQEGGVVMGVGYALSERFQVERGHPVTRTLKQCGLPTAVDAPEIVTVTVEVPHPWGPLGVKGLAEAPSLATAPAVANAIFDAVGVRMVDLPMRPEDIKRAMSNEKD
ncbi:MAG: molybdopterin-dependent oxidoreductase, partial [Deltaproteobacteria bacterium]|nr:molybdopterin-dependent oxidoreductase [Deltaproteobacteria bacterium]